MSTYPTTMEVFLAEREGVATVILSNPARRNALSIAMWSELRSLVIEADCRSSVRAIVIRGTGNTFGSGNDIKELNALRGNPDAATQFGATMAAAVRAVQDTSKPVVAAIEGACYGASLALALAADVRLASNDAEFAITPAKLGALYLRTDLHRLAAAVGISRAKWLIYTARTIGASTAERIGLVDDVFEANAFDEQLDDFMKAISAGSGYTLKRTKQMLGLAGFGSVPQEDAGSLAYFVEATQGADFAEGLDAFLTKRVPRFGWEA